MPPVSLLSQTENYLISEKFHSLLDCWTTYFLCLFCSFRGKFMIFYCEWGIFMQYLGSIIFNNRVTITFFYIFTMDLFYYKVHSINLTENVEFWMILHTSSRIGLSAAPRIHFPPPSVKKSFFSLGYVKYNTYMGHKRMK